MTTVARLADAMTALYDALTAAMEPTPPGQPGLTIMLGAAPSAAMEPVFIIVGHDGSLDADGSLSGITESGLATVKFVGMGAPPMQEEDGVINCVAVCQTGDKDDLAGQITAAQQLLAACVAAVTDLHVSGLVFDSAGSVRLYTRQAGQGCAAEIAFGVTYSAPWD